MRWMVMATVFGIGLLGTSWSARAGCEFGREATREAGAQVLTLEEAATFLRLDRAGLADAAARGDVPGRRILGTWRFSRAALIAWLAGANDPTDCFEGELAVAAPPQVAVVEPDAKPKASAGAGLPPGAMARITGAGPASASTTELAQESGSPPAAEAPQDQGGGDQPERFGEEPELETARELALRQETVLGRRGALQLETDIRYARDENSVIVAVPPTLSVGEQEQETMSVALTTRYGLSERLQIEAGGALTHSSANVNVGLFEFDEEADDTSFGDVILGASYQLLNEGTTWPAVFLSGNGTVPTDGSDVYRVGGSLALTKRLDPTTLFGSVGYLHAFNADNRGLVPEDQVSATLGFVFAMNDRLAFRTAVGGRFFPDSEAQGIDLRSDEQFDLSFSLPTVLSENLSLEPSVSFGLDQSPGSRFSLGLSMIGNFATPGLF
jgi:Helix-turn-helix domain